MYNNLTFTVDKIILDFLKRRTCSSNSCESLEGYYRWYINRTCIQGTCPDLALASKIT